MSLETNIFDTLKTLVSSRVYPLVAPQGVAKPYITYQGITRQRENTLAGDGGLSNPRVQIDCYAETYPAAKSLALSVRGAMKTAAYKPLCITENEFHEPDIGLFRISQDYSIWLND